MTEDSLTESVYDAFLTAYLKKHPELTRDQAAAQLKKEFYDDTST